jgi:type IV pilus assembly protein PilM
MAKKNAVWGIDIGQCALKAIRCTLSDDGETIVADAFDYIEYPKLLTQPEADAEELVREALQQFLSRNPTKGDKVAVSVGGQAGLARFIKLPPVEVKKIPDIVKFEAKQQIPFKLEEVIWDYQQLPGTIVEEGFAMEAEVGLFAMKREQVFRAIAPYEKAAIDLDAVQLAPLCIYNAVAHDMLPMVEAYDPENAPEYAVILSIGTETTDLVITNGYRVWQRSIPLGGNHFTKQLTKELKLTFAKAEHLKRNARQAEDPKSLFQAMRPVFNDLEKEVRRSINFFRNNDRNAQLGKLVLLGNTTKLPGLPQYLEKNLEMEVIKPEAFNKLQGSEVVDSPAFKENVLSFAVCYGLALQGLGKAKLATNLVPRELLTARLIKEKKPWAVAALSVLLLGLMLNFVFHYLAWSTVKKDRKVGDVDWATAISAVSQVQSTASGYDSTDSNLKQKLSLVEAIGEEVIGNTDGRLLWIELLRALNATLPVEEKIPPGETPDPEKLPFGERKTLYITSFESQYFEDLTKWFTDPVKQRYLENTRAPVMANDAATVAPTTDPAATGATADAAAGGAATDQNAAASATPADAATTGDSATPTATADATAATGGTTTGAATTTTAPSTDAAAAELKGPEGAGWVIELKGYHFYNLNRETEGSKHLRRTLIRQLENATVWLPPGPNQPPIPWTMAELGIMFPIIAQDTPIDRKHRIPNPAAQGVGPGGATTGYGYGAAGEGYGASMGFGQGSGAFGGAAPMPRASATGTTGTDEKKKDAAPLPPKDFAAPKYSFVVQVAWQEKKLSERLEARRQKAREAAEAAAQASGGAAPAENAPADAAAPAEGAVPAQNGVPATGENVAPDVAAPPANGEAPPANAAEPPGAVPPEAAGPPATAIPPAGPEAAPPANGGPPAPAAAPPVNVPPDNAAPGPAPAASGEPPEAPPD